MKLPRRSIVQLLIIGLGSAAIHVLPARAAVPLDVDGNGTVDVATDIVYIARTLLGLPPVPASFRVADPSIPSDTVIGSNIDAIRAALDVDNNGVVDVATDIVYTARTLLGLPPVPASFRAVDPNIPSDPLIAANIDALAGIPTATPMPTDDAHGNPNRYSDPNQHSDAAPHADTDQHADSHSEQYAHADANGHSNADGHAEPN